MTNRSNNYLIIAFVGVKQGEWFRTGTKPILPPVRKFNFYSAITESGRVIDFGLRLEELVAVEKSD